MQSWSLFDKPIAPMDPAGPILQAVAESVIWDWAHLEARPGGRPPLRPEHGMVCLALPFSGARPGMIAISASHRLGAILAVAATGDPGAGSFSGEALSELTQLIREALLPMEEKPGLILAPSPLDPADWPGHEPVAAVTLRVNGYPLELRQWQS